MQCLQILMVLKLSEGDFRGDLKTPVLENCTLLSWKRNRLKNSENSKNFSDFGNGLDVKGESTPLSIISANFLWKSRPGTFWQIVPANNTIWKSFTLQIFLVLLQLKLRISLIYPEIPESPKVENLIYLC